MDDLAARIVSFGRLLRDSGLGVTPGTSLDTVRAAELIDVSDVRAFHAALRANLVASIDDYPAFEALFVAYWAPFAGDAPEHTAIPDLEPIVEGPPRPPEAVYALLPAALEELSGEGDSRLPGGDRSASDADLLTHKDFASFTAGDVLRARRLVRRLIPSLATMRSRRYRATHGAGEVDIRRTIRASRRSNGDALRLERRARRLRKLRIVALCDVSGSMDVYANWLLQFLYALQNEAGGVRTFVFSTRLHDVSHVLKRKRFEEALQAIADAVDTWSGGTAIGASLGEFNVRHGGSLVGPRTVVIVASDGWERGDTGRLAREMAQLKRRAHRVIWLNPLKGHDGYEPLAAGMAAALPHVDHFLAANSLDALERLRRTLASL